MGIDGTRRNGDTKLELPNLSMDTDTKHYIPRPAHILSTVNSYKVGHSRFHCKWSDWHIVIKLAQWWRCNICTERSTGKQSIRIYDLLSLLLEALNACSTVGRSRLIIILFSQSGALLILWWLGFRPCTNKNLQGLNCFSLILLIASVRSTSGTVAPTREESAQNHLSQTQNICSICNRPRFSCFLISSTQGRFLPVLL